MLLHLGYHYTLSSTSFLPFAACLGQQLPLNPFLLGYILGQKVFLFVSNALVLYFHNFLMESVLQHLAVCLEEIMYIHTIKDMKVSFFELLLW